MTADKTFLRKYFRDLRSSVKSEEKDGRICELTVGYEAFRKADTVFIYYSVGSEADTLRIIQQSFNSGKKVALPKCINKKGLMEFYYVTDLDEAVADGMFSLKEPDTAVCEKASCTDSSLCIVPALAIDKNGYRLGYGGGYYDRYLSSFKGMTVGLCFEECLCDELPHDEYDIKLNTIITDNKIYELK